MRIPASRFSALVALALASITSGVVAEALTSPVTADNASAAPTTTQPRPTTTQPRPTTTAPGPTTTVPAPTTTTLAGPPPRNARRIATAISTEKIRATSLPLQAMGIGLAVLIAVLAASGYVYGRVRSRIPAVAAQVGTASDAESPAGTPGGPPPATPLPPPPASTRPMPPPDNVNEWAPPS